MAIDYEAVAREGLKQFADRVKQEAPADQDADAIGQLIQTFCGQVEDENDTLFDKGFSLLDLLMSLTWISPRQYNILFDALLERSMALQKEKRRK